MNSRRSFLASLATLAAAPLALLGLKRAVGGDAPETVIGIDRAIGDGWTFLGIQRLAHVDPTLPWDHEEFSLDQGIRYTHEWLFVDPQGICHVVTDYSEAKRLYAKSVDAVLLMNGNRIVMGKNFHEFEPVF